MSKETQTPDMERRAFFGKATGVAVAGAAGTGSIFATLAVARGPEQAVTSDVRWGMYVDASKCATDCSSCVDACNDEHGLGGNEKLSRDSQKAQWIRKVNLKNKLTGHVSSLPMMCQHCETAPCVDVCPTGASMRREDGLVQVNQHTCIGCRYCMMACPYKARSFVHEALTDQVPGTPRGKGCVESCNFCVSKIDEQLVAGETPTTACQEACAKDGHNAIVFGDLNDPNSDVAKALAKQPTRQIRADLGLNTGVRYAGI